MSAADLITINSIYPENAVANATAVIILTTADSSSNHFISST